MNDLELEYQQTVEVMDAQNIRLYDALRQLNEYGARTDKRRTHRSSRKIHHYSSDADIKNWEAQTARQKLQMVRKAGVLIEKKILCSPDVLIIFFTVVHVHVPVASG